MNQATFDYIVKQKKGTSPLIKDTDKDGIANIYDCSPNDPNKQGWIHNVGAAIAEKVGAKGMAESIRERGTQVDETRELAKQERYKQEKETAVYKESVKAESQRKAIKARYEPSKKPTQTSGMGGFIRSFSHAKPKRTATTKTKGYHPVTRYVKKGGHYVKKTYYVPTKVKVASAPKQYADRNRDGVPDMFGRPSDRNRDGIPDILGINQRKGKAKPFRMF